MSGGLKKTTDVGHIWVRTANFQVTLVLNDGVVRTSSQVSGAYVITFSIKALKMK